VPIQLNATIGDIFQFRMLGQVNNQSTISVFNYRVSAIVGATDPNTTADAINALQILPAGVAGAALPCLPSNWSGGGVECQRVYPRVWRTVIRSDVWAPNGTNASIANTSNVAQVITRRTNSSGRSQVSDLHLPCPTATAAIVNGNLSAAQQALLATYAPALYTSISILAGAVVLDPVIWHRAPANPPDYWDVIFGFKVQPTVRTMRRRTVGLGI
jgi:hypothetical protein